MLIVISLNNYALFYFALSNKTEFLQKKKSDEKFCQPSKCPPFHVNTMSSYKKCKIIIGLVMGVIFCKVFPLSRYNINHKL